MNYLSDTQLLNLAPSIFSRVSHSKTRQRSSIRGVNSVSENSRLNTALWALTEKMYELTK